MTCEECDQVFKKVGFLEGQPDRGLFIDECTNTTLVELGRIRLWCPTLYCFSPYVHDNLIKHPLPHYEGRRYYPHVVVLKGKSNSNFKLTLVEALQQVKLKEWVAGIYMGETMVETCLSGEQEDAVIIQQYWDKDKKIVTIPRSEILQISRRTYWEIWRAGKQNPRWQFKVAT